MRVKLNIRHLLGSQMVTITQIINIQIIIVIYIVINNCCDPSEHYNALLLVWKYYNGKG